MPPRTNACQTCRRKRIKCDTTFPHCQQCVRANRQCPGPTQGPIIIDQTRLATMKARRKKTIPSLLRQPSSEYLITIAFVPEFISGFTCSEGKGQQSWLHALDDSDKALSLSLRATATAYCGVTAKNHSVLVTARKIYGDALSSQAKTITQFTEHSVAAVCTSVMLSLFEAICATSARAYVSHLQAAKRMLSLTRLDQQKKALLRHVAMHVGYQMVFASVAGFQVDDKSPLSDLEAWMSLDQLDRRPSYAAQVLHLTVHLGDLYAGKSNHQHPDNKTIENIKNKLQTLWNHYRKQTAFQGTLIYGEEENAVQFPNALTAMTVAYFESARILMSLIDSAKVPSALHMPIEVSCKSILHCARFLSRKSIGCSYLRMCLPLTLVGLYSMNPQYRVSAKWFLQTWLGGTALASLAAVACVRICSTNSPSAGNRLDVIDT